MTMHPEQSHGPSASYIQSPLGSRVFHSINSKTNLSVPLSVLGGEIAQTVNSLETYV